MNKDIINNVAFFAQRELREGEMRCELEFSSHEQLESWKLLSFFHTAEKLADRVRTISTEIARDDPGLVRRVNSDLATQCHIALDNLLEAIGIQAVQKELVFEALTLQLSGSTRLAKSDYLEGRAAAGNVWMLESASTPALQTATVWGEVIDHTDKALVVRFDVGGIPEKRDFLWDEIKAKPEDLPKGTAVIGRTELLLAPQEDESLSDGGRLQAIREEAQREMRALGIEPGEIGSRMLMPEAPGQDGGEDMIGSM